MPYGRCCRDHGAIAALTLLRWLCQRPTSLYTPHSFGSFHCIWHKERYLWVGNLRALLCKLVKLL